MYLWLLVEQDALGADPIKEMIHFLGKAALNFLLLTLCISPFAKRLKQTLLIQLRRVLGLYSFFWACLHLLVFAWLELNWQLLLFVEEVIKRPYMTLGGLTWVILLALSITSVTVIRRKMKKKWLKVDFSKSVKTPQNGCFDIFYDIFKKIEKKEKIEKIEKI